MNQDLLTVSLEGFFTVVFQSVYAIQNVKFLKVKDIDMMAWGSLQHTSHFKLCTSCSPHSYEIICLLGLLWTVVFSLNISLGVRPNENQGEKKKTNIARSG